MVQDSSQLLEVVAFDQAVALVPSSLARRNGRPDVVYRPVTDAAQYETVVVWRAGSRSPWIARFVQTAIDRAQAVERTTRAAVTS